MVNINKSKLHKTKCKWLFPLDEYLIILIFVGFVNCGTHQAGSCEECSQGNGHFSCNGDCRWMIDDVKKCFPKQGRYMQTLKYFSQNILLQNYYYQ